MLHQHNYIITMSTWGGYGGPVRTDIGVSTLRGCGSPEMTHFNNFHLGSMCWTC